MGHSKTLADRKKLTYLNSAQKKGTVLGVPTSVCVTNNNYYFVIQCNWKSVLYSDIWEPTLHKEVEFNCTVGSCQEDIFPFYTNTKYIWSVLADIQKQCLCNITSSFHKIFKGSTSVGIKSTKQL
jgi:hypothetical protein